MSSTPILIWTKVLGSSTYNSETTLSTGQDGSIYISGGKLSNSSTDAYLIKYTSDGTKVWTKLLATTGEDYTSAIVTSLDGSIYIAGSAGGALDGQVYAGNTDAFLTKFNPDGTKIWTKELGTASIDRATALSIGIDGSIFVAGYTLSALDDQINNGSADAFLTKYKPDGTKLWTKLLGTAGADTAFGLTTGLDGSIYLSGATTGALDGVKNNGNFDAFVTKFNADGLKSWTKQFGSTAEDMARDVATGLDGSIYICGITLGSFDGLINSGNYDAFLTKYSSDGVKIWTKFVGTSTEDQSYDLTIGIDGSIYMSGYTSGALDGQLFGGLQDGFLIKYNPDGTKIWTKLISTNQEDEAYGISTGIDGTIYVSGYTEGSINGQTITNADIFLAKYQVGEITVKNSVLSVIVDKGILGASPILLKGLTESFTYTDGVNTKHTVEYSGLIFDYNQIDSLITTVTRDGEFTSEFTKEINTYLGTELNITYSAAVKLVGAASIDTVLLSVSGADGNFVE
jgi:uncharacterized delta-60 repeat protein